MTCIVGVVHNGRVVMGGDSAGVSGYDLTVRGDKKVFRRGPFLFGFTSSFRMGQLLRFSLKKPRHPGGLDDYEYMVTRFVDAVRACLKEGGYAERHNEAEFGGTFLVGYRGRLYEIHEDYQVGEPLSGFSAIGCGGPFALGSLFATQFADMLPEQRVLAALRAAEQMSAGVRAPFEVLSMGKERK